MTTATKKTLGGIAIAVTAALVLTGCGVTKAPSAAGAGSASAAVDTGPLTTLKLIVPNKPGSGYDLTGRAAVSVMEEIGAAKGSEVTNLPGAGGTVGLARTITETGNADYLLMMGLGVVGAAYTNKTDAKVSAATPVARLIEESGAIFVPADSPYKTIGDLVTAWKADPGAFPVGGGSSPGGPDHLLPMQLAGAVGIDATKVNYIAYDGGGELLPAILGGKLKFAASGYGEFLEQVKSGALRVLAVSGDKRVPVIDAPTLKEQGIDLVFTNWRGLLAAPNLAEADKAKLIDAVTKMQASDQWKAVLKKNGWTDAFLTGAEFSTFLKDQDDRVAKVLKTLGLV